MFGNVDFLGGELFDYIVKKERLDDVEACRYFHQLLTGLDAIHARGVAHRDLKPENLLLDSSNNIKIVDFGLSNTYKTGEFLKTACGSPSYAAPEMISGLSYDPRSADLWSSGVILYAMLVGRLPFEDSNTSQLYRKITNGQYHIPSHVSDPARSLIKSLLQVDPSRRITMDGVRNSRWYQGLIFVDRLCDRPRALQFMSNEGCEVPSCLRCKSWVNEKDNGFPIDEQVLAEMTSYQFPLDYVIKCLKLNKHNHATTTYHLLAEKRSRNDVKVDLCKKNPPERVKPLFDPQLPAPNNHTPTILSLNFSNLPLYPQHHTPSPSTHVSVTARNATVRPNTSTTGVYGRVPAPRYATARTPSPGFSISSSSHGPVTVSRRLSPSLNLTVSSLSRHTASTKAKAQHTRTPKPSIGFGSTTSRFGPAAPVPRRVPPPFTVFTQDVAQRSSRGSGKPRPSSARGHVSFGSLFARASLMTTVRPRSTVRPRVW